MFLSLRKHLGYSLYAGGYKMAWCARCSHSLCVNIETKLKGEGPYFGRNGYNNRMNMEALHYSSIENNDQNEVTHWRSIQKEAATMKGLERRFAVKTTGYIWLQRWYTKGIAHQLSSFLVVVESIKALGKQKGLRLFWPHW